MQGRKFSVLFLVVVPDARKASGCFFQGGFHVLDR